MSKDISTTITTKIKNWLTEEGLQSNQINDPKIDANITFWANPDLKMHALIRRDRITVLVSILFTDNVRTILSNQGKLEDFFRKLNLSLYQHPCDFKRHYNESKELIGLIIEKRIWEESLTKTSFFDAMLSVINCSRLLGIRQEELVKYG